MKRVYYSRYIPVVKSSFTEGISETSMLREHRIYQADWLLRFYGFKADEILNKKNPYFDLRLDPKMNWAIENIEKFPLEINRASFEELMRVPGIGRTYALRIINARRFAALNYDDLKSLKISTKNCKNFITVRGVYRGINVSTKEALKDIMSAKDTYACEQLKMW